LRVRGRRAAARTRSVTLQRREPVAQRAVVREPLDPCDGLASSSPSTYAPKTSSATFLTHRVLEYGDELLARPREAAHHRAHRHAEDFGCFLAGQALATTSKRFALAAG
jgi:hypothetical protein